jgi:AAA+ ATPase superfamily predicted ATPase
MEALMESSLNEECADAFKEDVEEYKKVESDEDWTADDENVALLQLHRDEKKVFKDMLKVKESKMMHIRFRMLIYAMVLNVCICFL